MSVQDNTPKTRRDFLKDAARGVGALALAGSLGAIAARASASHNYVWQVDPNKCIQCGNCATACVLTPSAVKCVHTHAICGYCKLCFGYFEDSPAALNEAAENQRCPTAAILRSGIEDPYYEYIILEDKCIGCGLCVKGCNQFGNGSLYLQIRHDRCVNCNQCRIAVNCPAQAIIHLPAGKPYLLKPVESPE